MDIGSVFARTNAAQAHSVLIKGPSPSGPDKKVIVVNALKLGVLSRSFPEVRCSKSLFSTRGTRSGLQLIGDALPFSGLTFFYSPMRVNDLFVPHAAVATLLS